MIVLINAVSIKEGGSLVVFQNLLREFVSQRPDIGWHVAVNDRIPEVPELLLPGVVVHVFSDPGTSFMRVKWWYNITLPALVRSIKADVLFSQTNYLPDVPLRCRTLLLEHHAGYFSAIFTHKMRSRVSWMRMLAWQVKKHWVVSSLKKADRVTVQTEALASSIVKAIKLDRKKISVIPHGPGLAHIGSAKYLPLDDNPLRIGYITKYGVQKNFEVLIAAMKILVDEGQKVQLDITLDAKIPECREVLGLVDEAGITAFVHNHGHLEAEQVRYLYENLDLFVFPSLCESFGFPLLEAMACGLPILISDTQSNIEIMGGGEFSFPAEDSHALARLIRQMLSPEKFQQASGYGIRRAEFFSWAQAAEKTLDVLVELSVQKSGMKVI